MRSSRGRNRSWRSAFAALHRELKSAEKLPASARHETLVRVCRAVLHLDVAPRSSWNKGWRVHNARTASFDRAEAELETALAKAVGGCLGCFAQNPLPGDRPRRHRVRHCGQAA